MAEYGVDNDNQLMYRRLPFSLQQMPGGHHLLYSFRGVSVVESTGIVRFLRSLDSLSAANVSEQDADTIWRNCGLPDGECIRRSTKDLGVLGRRMPGREIDKIIVFSDDEHCSQVLKDGLRRHKHIAVCDSLNPTDGLSGSLIVLFQSQYNPAGIESLYRSLTRHRDALVVTSYLMSRTFFVDGLYSLGGAIPCHFCHMARLERIGAAWRDTSASDWWTFHKKLSARYGAVPAALPMDNVDRGAAMFHLRTVINRLVNVDADIVFSDEVLSFTQLDLDDGAEVRDIVPHNSLCECIDGWERSGVI